MALTQTNPYPGTPPDAHITATGNLNKTPGLGLSQGGDDYEAKYATYLKLFSGEMIKAYTSACIAKHCSNPHSPQWQVHAVHLHRPYDC